MYAISNLLQVSEHLFEWTIFIFSLVPVCTF